MVACKLGHMYTHIHTEMQSHMQTQHPKCPGTVDAESAFDCTYLCVHDCTCEQACMQQRLLTRVAIVRQTYYSTVATAGGMGAAS